MSDASVDAASDNTVKGDEQEPKIIAFLCNWCSYTGADLAGTSRLQYPPNVRVIRVMCSGRINPQFVLRSFQEGVDGVLVSGCHPGDCHYMHGNYHARRKLTLLKDFMEYMNVNPKRFQMSWVSASECHKFAEVITRFTKQVKELGPMKGLEGGD
jgi:coenzyme F420-reducing hydrogenase delta subunit